MRFENKTIIITGAGGGIGRASALRLAREGAYVVCMDIAESREETVNLIKEGDVGGATAVAYDALDSEDVKKVFRESISTHGPIDGLVNCVGAGLPRSALEIDEEAFDKMFDMNVENDLPRLLVGAAPHAGAKKRQDRQFLLRRGPFGQRAPGAALFERQGRRHRPDAPSGARVRPPKHQRERGRSGRHRHRAHPRTNERRAKAKNRGGHAAGAHRQSRGHRGRRRLPRLRGRAPRHRRHHRRERGILPGLAGTDFLGWHEGVADKADI